MGPVWYPNWQGHLIFFDKDGDEVSKIVEHKANRAVLFPGTIKHYADAPSRFFNGLRISLAYKLWKKIILLSLLFLDEFVKRTLMGVYYTWQKYDYWSHNRRVARDATH